MKILFCPTHYVFDGHERGSEISWAFQIADRISRLYPSSTVVSGFSNESNKPYELILLQKEKKQIDMGILNSLIFSIQYGIKATQLIKKGQYDIHHHILPFAIGKTFNLCALLTTKTPFVVGPIQSLLPFYPDNIHDTKATISIWSKYLGHITHTISKCMYPLTNYLSNLTLQRAKAIVVVDDVVRRTLLSLNIDNTRIHVIPPGIDLKNASNKRRCINKNVRTILSVGALIERKGFEILIKSIACIKEGYPEIRLEILGDGPRKQELMDLSESLGVRESIIFHGLVPHSEVKQYYDRADIFVTASRFESRGQMYLEAMASGLPIISTVNYGASSILGSGVGIIVPKDNVSALSEAITTLINDHQLRVGMSHKSLIAAEEYDWDRVIIPQYLNLYEKCRG